MHRESHLFPHLKAVLLDVDGTLIHSNRAHALAYVEAGREMGLELDFEQVRRMIEMGGDKLLPRAAGFAEHSSEGERLTRRKKEIFLERLLPELEPTRGARELLLHLRAEGIQRVVATSAGRDEMTRILEQAGVADLIQEETSSDDAAESKPDPDIVRAALRKAGCAPEEALMLGDTPYDVEAATRAGVRVIALRSGGWEDDALRGALAIVDDPADLLRDFRVRDAGFGIQGNA